MLVCKTVSLHFECLGHCGADIANIVNVDELFHKCCFKKYIGNKGSNNEG